MKKDKTIKVIKNGTIEKLSIKDFWNYLGAGIGGGGLGERMEYSETHPGADIDERRKNKTQNTDII